MASKQSVTSGAVWMIAARFIERFIGLASTVVLARLLAPSDFGLVAMAMVFVAAADTLGAFGLDWALVRQPEIARKHLDTAWSIRAAFGMLSFFALAALSVPAANFYNEPRITSMVLVLGLSLLIGSLENPGIVMYRREMNFTKEFQVRAVAKLVSSVVAIVSAIILKSYWALLLGTFVARAVSTIVSYAIHPHRPRPTLEARDELLSFSAWLWLANLLTFLRVRMVELILGRIIGARGLGLFSVANELSQLASTELAAPINRALFSAYASKGGEPAAVGKAYLEGAPVVWALALPVVLAMFVGAPQLVLLVLGPQWSEAVPLLRWLAVAAVFNLLSAGAIQVYWAINRANLEAAVEFGWVISLLGFVLWLTSLRGVEGAAMAVLASNALLLPVNVLLLRRFAQVSMRATLARSWRVFTSSAAMFGLVYVAYGHEAPRDAWDAVAQIAGIAVLSVVVYAAALFGQWRVVGRPPGLESWLLGRIATQFDRIRARGGRSVAQAPPMEAIDAAASTALVSVIIPAYNCAAFIGQAIQCVLKQTHRALEIIVVDDGSSDETCAIAESFESGVRVLRQYNRGSAAARNHGISVAHGQYVAFLDADDFWHPRKIELQLAHLEHCDDCVAVFCNKLEIHGGQGEPDWEAFDAVRNPVELAIDTGNDGWMYFDLLRDSAIQTSTVIVRRGALDAVGHFDESLRKGQDLEYWIRLSQHGRIHKLARLLSAYRIHAESISHRAMSRNYHADILASALARYGRSDGSGATISGRDSARILGASWLEFAYQHFRLGSDEICRDSIRRALQFRPWYLRAWLLNVRMALRARPPRPGDGTTG